MISARTARIDDNLGRGTDGSNPLPSSVESGANLIFGAESHRSLGPHDHADCACLRSRPRRLLAGALARKAQVVRAGGSTEKNSRQSYLFPGGALGPAGRAVAGLGDLAPSGITE